MSEKLRYSDEELEEFRQLILEKLEVAQKQYESLCSLMTNGEDNSTSDTSRSYNALEEGAATLSKEQTSRLAERQRQFISHLKAALVRIENKTYGICRVTGKLIPKERLRLVPHATLSVDAKENKR